MSKALLLNDDELSYLFRSLEDDIYGRVIKKRIAKLKQPIRVSSRKAKGRNLQEWVCEQIAKVYNITYVQSDDNCSIHSREMGQCGTDVILRGELYDKFKWDIECKNQEKLQINTWIEQAKSNTKIGRDYLIVFKNKQIKNPHIVMSWDAFIKLEKGDEK